MWVGASAWRLIKHSPDAWLARCCIGDGPGGGQVSVEERLGGRGTVTP